VNSLRPSHYFLPTPVTSPMRSIRSGAAILLLAALAAGCTKNLGVLHDPPRSSAVATAYPWISMVYVTRTDSGVVVIDLGWYGASRALHRELRRMGMEPEAVTDVFLTHSHRDHIAAWKVVRHARFHMAADEVPLFLEQRKHRDLPSRVANFVLGNSAPPPVPVRVSGFARDTAFVFGADTLHAFTVPGHTDGSTAYLFRSVLFTGDATVHVYPFGAGPSMRIFTADVRRSRASLAALRERMEGRRVEWICTAHAKCARWSERYWNKVLRDAVL
jgi:glyoxylase-like metal-dependent hydrolase (beta-lactamase superfamily II)